MTALVVKVTEVVGRYSDAGDAEGIADDDGGHMVTFDELLPEGVEGKRGTFKITCEWKEEP